MFLKFFGLNEQPFGVTPDPRFLYMSPAHEEAFASLVYGIESGRGFVALIAGPGLGKTTVLLRLMERLQDSARTAFLFQTHLQSGEFLKSIFADLGIESPGEGMGELQRRFSEVLMQEWRAGKRVVVAIDEAQNLDDATLEMVRMLSNFETSQAKLLQIVLVGQKELADKLARPNLEQLRQRVSIITHFPPFSQEEVTKYINHRLRTAGYKGRQLFTPVALRLIAMYSHGVPRTINNVCFQALSLAFAQNQKVVNEAILREVISDLNLQRFGTQKKSRPPSSRVAAPSLGGAKAPTPGTSPRIQDWGPPTPPAAGSLLEGVELASAATEEDARFQAAAGEPSQGLNLLPHAEARGGRELRLSLLAVGLLSILLWAAPRLKATFESFMGPTFTAHEGSAPRPASAERGPISVTPGVSPAATQREGSIVPGPVPPVNSQTVDHATAALAQPAALPFSKTPDVPPPVSQRDAVSGLSPVSPPTGEGPAAPTAPEKPRHSDRAAHEHARDDLGAYRGADGSLLVVESSESGAQISINGRTSPKWVTPHVFSLARGVYNVTVLKAGYMPWTRQVRLQGYEKWLMANFANPRGLGDTEDDATFAVETDPPGMQVFVDGKAYGPSRVETELPAGWHVCEVITMPGTPPVVSRFHLDSGEILTKKIRVTPGVAPAGEAKIPPSSLNQPRKN